MIKQHYCINEDWVEYYQILEKIRQSGITNMWAADIPLAALCHIDNTLASKILISWIENYSTLNERFHWQ